MLRQSKSCTKKFSFYIFFVMWFELSSCCYPVLGIQTVDCMPVTSIMHESFHFFKYIVSNVKLSLLSENVNIMFSLCEAKVSHLEQSY